MKTITIGDIHGRPYWKQVDPEKYDRIIFVGDFTDSSNPKYTAQEIIDNLLEIIEFKKKNMDKVQLIPGNHCLPYIFTYRQFPCSRHMESAYPALHKIFQENLHLFVPAYQIKNYIWTHAGITEGWLNMMIKESLISPNKELAPQLDVMFRTVPRKLGMVSEHRGGFDHEAGPFWADFDELKPLPGYHQIVGHNRVPTITIMPAEEAERKNSSIVFTDCQDRVTGPEAFYELEIPD